jgi:hypothetical protein
MRMHVAMRKNILRILRRLMYHRLPSALVSFSDVGIRDCFVIQELLKEIAATNQLDANSQRSFKGMRLAR